MNTQQKGSETRREELQGARPPPLKICKESRKIRKPAPAVLDVPSMPIINRSRPIIIHIQSPKIIHAEVQDFMTLVQRLTGSSSSSDTHSFTRKSENVIADHSRIISQASDATMSSHPTESVDQNMGSSHTDNTACCFNIPSLINERVQEIESRAFEPEATGRAQPAAGDSCSTPILTAPISPFSPNFLFPSQRLLSPSNFKDFPLFSPDFNNFFNSQCSILL